MLSGCLSIWYCLNHACAMNQMRPICRTKACTLLSLFIAKQRLGSKKRCKRFRHQIKESIAVRCQSIGAISLSQWGDNEGGWHGSVFQIWHFDTVHEMPASWTVDGWMQVRAWQNGFRMKGTIVTVHIILCQYSYHHLYIFKPSEDNAAWEKQLALACQTTQSRNLVLIWLKIPVDMSKNFKCN